MADTQAPPAPGQPSVYQPQAPAAVPPAVTIGWTAPPSQVKAPAEPRKPKRRALPAGPALSAAGNGAVIAITSAYDAAGWVGLAGAAGAAAAGTAGAAVWRRRTVRTRRTAASPRRQGANRGGSGSPRTGSGSGWNLGGSQRSDGSRTGSGVGGAAGSRTSRQGSPRTGGGNDSRTRTGRDRTGGTDRPNRSGKTKSDRSANRHRRRDSRARATLAAARHRAARAWATDRPRRTRNRQAALRGLRTLSRAFGNAWTSLLIGLWAALRHRSTIAGARGAAAAWKRRRTPAAPPPVEPTVAPTVRRPTATTSTTTYGAPAVSGHHFVAPAMEAARIAAGYAPTGMMQVGQDFAGLQQALELNAEAMKITVENADARFPLAPQIVDLMRQIHSLQLKAAAIAQELQPAFRSLHHVDIARIESPRKGAHAEAMWDVTRNTP